MPGTAQAEITRLFILQNLSPPVGWIAIVIVKQWTKIREGWSQKWLLNLILSLQSLF